MNAALDAYLPKSRRVPLSPGYAEQEGEEAGRSVYDLFQLHLAVGGWGRVAVVQIVGWGTRGMAQSGTWVRIGRNDGWKGPDSGPVGCLGLGSTFGSKARNQIPLV